MHNAKKVIQGIIYVLIISNITICFTAENVNKKVTVQNDDKKFALLSPKEMQEKFEEKRRLRKLKNGTDNEEKSNNNVVNSDQ